MPEVSTTPDSLTTLETLLGYRFENRDWLTRALTHRSFVNEQEEAGLQNNESLEFLGDAVLGFLVSSRVFELYPDLREGELSKIKAYLVSAANLVRLAEELQLGIYLRLSKGEEKTGGRKKRALLVDAYEAVIGAIYMDGGIEAASRFVTGQIAELLERSKIRELTLGDFKSSLQEYLHDLGCPEPVYRVVDEVGPDHKKVFFVEVVIQNRPVAKASGRTKKEAQQLAAQQALESLKG